MKARFTWDPAKAERNQRNHVVAENYFIESDGEQRYRVIGMTRGLVLLLVVFADRLQADVEVIHLISARKAVDYEESIYHDQFR
jgi:uncharacterized DUF497 family protein